MPAGSTYTPIATTTLGSAQATITFNSFSGYTDLILVCNVGTDSTNAFPFIQFNGDTGTNYSYTQLYGTGSTASSVRLSNSSQLFNNDVSVKQTSINSNIIYQIMNYSNSTTFKTALVRQNTVDAADYNGSLAAVGLWRNTAAITSIAIKATRAGSAQNFSIGSTFTLYGIASA